MYVQGIFFDVFSAPKLEQFLFPKMLPKRCLCFLLRLFQLSSVWKFGQFQFFLFPLSTEKEVKNGSRNEFIFYLFTPNVTSV